MAKINASFDTVEKTCSVSMDGVDMPNARNVMFGMCGDDEWCCDIMSFDYDKEGDVKTYHHLVAKDSEKHKEAIAQGLECTTLGDFIKIKVKPPVKQQIVNLIASLYQKKK